MGWLAIRPAHFRTWEIIAGLSGGRHLRKLVSQQRYRIAALRQGEYRYE
jgi:hypothetical protein